MGCKCDSIKDLKVSNFDRSSVIVFGLMCVGDAWGYCARLMCCWVVVVVFFARVALWEFRVV